MRCLPHFLTICLALSTLAIGDIQAANAQESKEPQIHFCATLMPCGAAPAFDVLPQFSGDPFCGGPRGIYTLRCANLKLAYQNQQLLERIKRRDRRNRKKKQSRR